MATPNTYIKWSYWGGGGTLIDYGQMPLTDVQKHIQRFEKEAKKLLDEKSNECGWDAVDHVVYAIKTRDEDAPRLRTNPMMRTSGCVLCVAMMAAGKILILRIKEEYKC